MPSHSVSRIQSLLIPVGNLSKYEMILKFSFHPPVSINHIKFVTFSFCQETPQKVMLLLLSSVPPN
jgi:hypothetical protein